ncbi:MAG TPA: hypothetical protein VMW58_13830, partial [Anaerolineae bacterium]|nr:hypothetical protein [Anaerolineae bacterium]
MLPQEGWQRLGVNGVLVQFSHLEEAGIEDDLAVVGQFRIVAHGWLSTGSIPHEVQLDAVRSFGDLHLRKVVPTGRQERAVQGCRSRILVLYSTSSIRKGATAVLLVEANPHSLALIVQLLMSLWLGLYILTHGADNRASRLAAAAMLSMAGYFFAATMLLNSPMRDSAVFWARTLRLIGPPFFVLFLHMTVELRPAGRISW